MGQSVIGIMYGCSFAGPENDVAYDRFYNVVDSWNGALTAGLDEGAFLVGLWVAVGGSGMPKAAEFNYPRLPLSAEAFTADKAYASEAAAAQAEWDAFVVHVATSGVHLVDKPQLWLTTAEVA